MMSEKEFIQNVEQKLMSMDGQASLGKGDEKKNLIIKFKKEFPRHSAFHGELQRYSDRI